MKSIDCLAVASILYPLMGTVSIAHAESMVESQPQDHHIFGGEEVETCDWPTTVFLGGCTGTLVHPEVITVAAHCVEEGSGPGSARFGERGNSAEREVSIKDCTYRPEYDQDGSYDAAYCLLDEPVTDVPIVPILMGCETEELEEGREITLVGFGNTEDDIYGVKHAVVTTINEVLYPDPEVSVGGGGMSACNGDSGGPAYLQMDDGTWRVFGITSRAGSPQLCPGPAIYGLIHEHVEWIEEETGLDITPCHDANGDWNPSEDCTEFPLDPGVGESDWDDACAPARLSGPSATCGDPIGGGGDDGGSDSSGGDSGDAESGGSDDQGGSDTSGAASGTEDSGLPGGTGADDGGSSGSGPTNPTSGVTVSGGIGSSLGSTDDDDDDSGCGCRTSSTPSPLSWMLLPLLALFGRRRSALSVKSSSR